MGRKPDNDKPQRFDVRVVVDGKEGELLTEFIAEKMKKERRPSMKNTVESILLDIAQKYLSV